MQNMHFDQKPQTSVILSRSVLDLDQDQHHKCALRMCIIYVHCTYTFLMHIYDADPDQDLKLIYLRMTLVWGF